jgi:hypothetical protein
MTINTELKTELKEVCINITNAGKGKAKYFFDYDYAIRGEESRTLYEYENSRLYLSYYDALLNNRWDSEYDIRPIVKSIIKKMKALGKVDNIAELTLTVDIKNVSRKTYDGLDELFKCPITVMHTTIERLVIKRKIDN